MRRPRPRCPALLLTALLLGPAVVHSQPVDPAFAGGLQAFEEARYEEAARLLRRAGRCNAEAYYLLARIYLETPLQDDRHAREAILKALDLEPDNVRFLDLRLRQYRADATNHATDAEQRAIRKHLAEALLAHDPDHALARIERGRAALDAYEWRVYGTAQFPNKGYFKRKKEKAFTDLSYVLNDTQIRAYEQDPSGYAAAFWIQRDARLLTPENERHNEHMARLVSADVLFGDAGHGVHGRKPQQGVALGFAGTGTTRDDRHYLILDAADQPPRRYVLALQVHDTVTGQRVEVTREIFLEDRGSPGNAMTLLGASSEVSV